MLITVSLAAIDAIAVSAGTACRDAAGILRGN